MSPTYLFSKKGKSALERFLNPKTLFSFDFDGTLVALSNDFTRILVPLELKKRLRAIARLAPVAVISGRSARDAQWHLKLKEVRIIGNHGAEGLKRKLSAAEAKRTKKAIQAWVAALSEVIKPFKGVAIEDKALSLSVHYRLARRKRALRPVLLKALARIEPSPRIVHGKMVVNVVSPSALHKGHAVKELMKEHHLRRALFVGDDITDEDAFRLPDRDILSVRVGFSKKTAARFYLRHQGEVARLLDLIADRLGSKG